MSFVAVAIGGGSLISGGLGYLGATQAAGLQANAANQSLQFQENAFNTSQGQLNAAKANYQPYLDIGNNATYTLGQLTGTGGGGNAPNYSSFFEDPSYQFAQQQGQRGALAAANAQGVGLSGGTLKDLSEFNQGLASQQYGNYFNRLMGLSQMGQNAAAGLGNLATGQATNATNAAGQIGNTTQAVGQAQASGIVGGTNAITGSINSGISNSLLASYLGNNGSAYKLNNPAYGGGNSSSGDAFGGTSSSPLPGLNANDYGMGF